MWFTDHGRDWMGDDGPEDELNRMSKTGANFGFPYCHANGVADKDIKKANPCDGVTLPVDDDGPARRGDGRAFLHRQHVPGRVPQRDVRCAQGLVEPDAESRVTTW